MPVPDFILEMAQTVNIAQDDDQFALVKISKDAKKPMVEGVEAVPLGAKNLIEKTHEPYIFIPQEEALVSNDLNGLAEMSNPVSTSTQGPIMCSSEVLMVENDEDDNTRRYKIGEIRVGDQCSNPNFSLVDEVIGNFSCFGQPIFIDEVHLSKAHYMFDKVPKRDNDDANESFEIIARDDILGSIYMFDESLCPNLESILSLKHEIMLINVKFQHFIPLLGVKNELVISWVKKIMDLDDLSWNLNGSMDCNVLVFCKFENNIHLLLVLVCLCFDPGGKKLKPLLLNNPTLEDKGDFRGEEEKICVKYTWKLFICVFSWRNCLYSRMSQRVEILTYNFDPDGLY
ncbi:hypothetical protein RND81_05G050000 [Saponaria officinalis]|uniref:Uncharacterized protein n=1 Tax=Saponaria officinalis TaxID=3572 RepID=A0AAW1KQT1_SAPOF